MLGTLLAWDESVFHLINATWISPTLDRLMPMVTDAGNYFIPFILGAILLLVMGRLRGLRFLALALIGVVVADAIGNHVFKQSFLRHRPCVALEGVRLLVGCTPTPSLPSNHAVNASTLATLVGLYIPRLWFPAAALAMLVGYSRVYVGVHYPLDVLFGGVLGIVVALGLSGIMTRVWPPDAGPDGQHRGFSLRIEDS